MQSLKKTGLNTVSMDSKHPAKLVAEWAGKKLCCVLKVKLSYSVFYLTAREAR